MTTSSATMKSSSGRRFLNKHGPVNSARIRWTYRLFFSAFLSFQRLAKSFFTASV